MELLEPRTHRWTLERYLEVADSGALGNHRVELIDGEIIDMPPQKEPHALAVARTIRQLMELFPEPFYVKSQSTYRLSHSSAPEPDIMLLPTMADHGQKLHDLALLVIEVSDTTFRYDRVTKGSLYASRGIRDYWIINIPEDQVEIYRDPIEDDTSRFGWKYQSHETRKRGDRVPLLADPQKSLEIDRMLP